MPDEPKHAMNFLYWLGWLSFRAAFATFFRWRVYGTGNVPQTGPVILAANHASYLDPPLVGAGLTRPIHYLARRSLFRFPLIGPLLRKWKAVPLDRDGGGSQGMKVILERLRAGGGIVLFPEGTRSHDGRLQSPEAGIGFVVAKSEAPVVPVRVFGTFEAFGRQHKVPRPRQVAVVYGEPMRFEKLRARAATCDKARLREIYREIAGEIMTAIARLEQGEYRK
ncbi:MAG: 1-acyl-sn-glycerol-3-phosphate acyltransferase [Verrucomicrobia bacterium]|nr:1-acyl-sn-glycerol-3-phosphate acyltransferase [Verrucomicrobiota bacterium]MDE3098970.1 1-acyl-sn-glycerol-3-phosphate acyltransferase [Verrucomicrobiota bacterium]